MSVKNSILDLVTSQRWGQMILWHQLTSFTALKIYCHQNRHDVIHEQQLVITEFHFLVTFHCGKNLFKAVIFVSYHLHMTVLFTNKWKLRSEEKKIGNKTENFDRYFSLLTYTYHVAWLRNKNCCCCCCLHQSDLLNSCHKWGEGGKLLRQCFPTNVP